VTLRRHGRGRRRRAPDRAGGLTEIRGGRAPSPAERRAMQLYCGTSGFSYKEWKGRFYPAGLAAADMLTHYASRLPTVEINNTFYRLPQRSLLERWRDQVPPGFRFAVKTSRRITHVKRLADCADEARFFFEAVHVLGEKLGAVLVQLPPQFRVDVDRLRRFLDLVPSDVPAAFEFRHPSWRDDAVPAAPGYR